MRVKIHHEGTNILIVSALIVLAINVPLWLWVRPIAWAIVSTAVWGVLYLFVVNFFRSPRRQFKGSETNVVVASADGKVVALEETFEDEYLHGPA
ncbi:MAG: phosphatidylserine decarboxylase family protein, partial [Muribaculaceae bacterium]|nr:phosphatidylserine decarboxylase family protein [Muribaculaceae bacterium]